MKPNLPGHRSKEIELKLALPTSDPTGLPKRLAQTPVLARRKAVHTHMYNVYYDTPNQILRRERVALRLRRTDSDAKPQWLQTLKTGGHSNSALSRRGEWEAPVPGAALTLHALKASPWSRLDPDGSVFKALAPCFVTTFERTSWVVRRRDGSVVEVALDIGQIAVDGSSTPICELELELLAGQPAALFEISHQIARTIAVLPLNLSKAERGYALAQNCLDQPQRVQPPKLTRDLSLRAAAQRVLREMFCQFTTNLNALRTSDDPEVVHQARVGWRRFRSAWRLFKPALPIESVATWLALRPLLTCLGELRDLDVARSETLPPFADAFAAADARRAQAWQQMSHDLLSAANLQRKAVRYALQEPSVGASLLAITQWLEGLSSLTGPEDAMVDSKVSLRRWTKRRIVRLHDQLQHSLEEANDANNLHRTRIFAKRLRYGIEALRSLLPKRRTGRWHKQATSMQMSIGGTRDVVQAATLVARLDADRGLVEFLRGVAFRQERQE